MNVCRQCGLAGNTLTCLAKYGELPKKYAFDVSTMHTGICGICGRKATVTEERDYFYPNWKFLQKSSWRAALTSDSPDGKDND